MYIYNYTCSHLYFSVHVELVTLLSGHKNVAKCALYNNFHQKLL